jgi:hypothetical protein
VRRSELYRPGSHRKSAFLEDIMLKNDAETLIEVLLSLRVESFIRTSLPFTASSVLHSWHWERLYKLHPFVRRLQERVWGNIYC